MINWFKYNITYIYIYILRFAYFITLKWVIYVEVN